MDYEEIIFRVLAIAAVFIWVGCAVVGVALLAEGIYW